MKRQGGREPAGAHLWLEDNCAMKRPAGSSVPCRRILVLLMCPARGDHAEAGERQGEGRERIGIANRQPLPQRRMQTVSCLHDAIGTNAGPTAPQGPRSAPALVLW